MTPGLSRAERDAIERAHRQRYQLSRAPRFQPMPAQDPAQGVAGPAMQKSSRGRLLTLAKPPFAVRMLNRMSYGATPQSVAEFNALGSSDSARLTAWVDRQLNPSAINDSAVATRLANAGYTTLGKTLAQQWAEHVRAPDLEWRERIRPGTEAQRECLVRAVFSNRQLFEVTTMFWHDHFNVMVSDGSIAPVFGHYSRDVIRANAFGNFRTMLEAVAQSAAMMYYLDNRSNSRSGPNENFGRELLELHTMGAENYLGFMDPFQVPPCPEDPSYPIGYTDIDVYETAAAFTGWTINDGRNGGGDDGSFRYYAAWHDSGPKFVLGTFIYPERPAMQDGRDILDRLASHPRVAKFICRKLVRRFVSDAPSQALVDSAAKVFRDNWRAPDQIRKTLRHILLSEEAQHAWGRKSRRPFEAVAASLRALGCDWTYKPDSLQENRSNDLNWRLNPTGHQPYDWAAPNGYPDTATAWSGASSFGLTWRVLLWLTETSNPAGDNKLLPILELTRAGVPANQWTANRLVDFWCRRILGYLPKSQRISALRAFLAQNGDPASYVIEDTNGWNQNDLKRHYNQERLRSMVALILMSPEFMSR